MPRKKKATNPEADKPCKRDLTDNMTEDELEAFIADRRRSAPAWFERDAAVGIRSRQRDGPARGIVITRPTRRVLKSHR